MLKILSPQNAGHLTGCVNAGRPGYAGGMSGPSPAQPRHHEQRQDWAESLAQRLDRPMSVLGLLFLLVVLGSTLATEPQITTALAVAGWLLWLVFVGEFLLRWYVAPDRVRFIRKFWWQAVFLAVPFLRFVRLLRAVRAIRAARVVSSAVRGSRSAGSLLTGRVGWLLAVTAILVLAASQLLIVAGTYEHYGPALHDVALATIAGHPLQNAVGWLRVLNVFLAAYSVAVFATLAATIGAYFMRPAHSDGESPD